MKRQKEFLTENGQKFYLSEYSCKNGFKDVGFMLPLDQPQLMGDFELLGSYFPVFWKNNEVLFQDTFGSDDLYDNLCNYCNDGLFKTLPSLN